MFSALLLFISSLAIILVACHIFTNGVEWLGKRLGVSDGVVGSIFAGVGTALPETMIPLMAIFFTSTEVGQEIGQGAIIGAPFMLATLSLPLAGLGVLVYTQMGKRSIHLNLDTRQLDMELRLFLLAFSVGLAASMVESHLVHQLVAAFLVLLYVYYVRRTMMDEGADHDEEIPPLFFARTSERPHFFLIYAQILFSLTAIVGGAHLFVGAVEEIAAWAGVSALILSLLITPIATELPEKMNSLIWLYRGKDQMAIGNITGAMVFQATFPVVIGLLGTPWQLDQRLTMAGGFSIIATAVLLLILRLKGGLKTVHLMLGALLYALYAYLLLR